MIKQILRKTRKSGLILTAAFCLAAVSTSALCAQSPADAVQATILQPLFAYPTAPDDLEGLKERSEWIVENFWTPMDFKSKQAVDQNKLNHAFKVFTVPMQWAGAETTDRAVSLLIKKLQKNPILLFQFTRAAEEALFGPRADCYIDPVYKMFLSASLKNKKTPLRYKNQWQHQYTCLEASHPGADAPEFTYFDSMGEQRHYHNTSTIPTLIIFGDPTDSNLRGEVVRTSSQTKLDRSLRNGRGNILFILPPSGKADSNTDWSFLPDRWLGGKAESELKFDTRALPSCYLIDTDGKIASRHYTLGHALEAFAEMVGN